MLRSDQLTAPQPALWWTPWPGIGPGQEVLGDLNGRTVVDLGCGRGDNAAACAAAGAAVVGVDVDDGKVQDARTRWQYQPRLRFLRSECSDYLSWHSEPIDVVYSIFGALSFSPAERLLELVAGRLRRDGTLALSARLPPPDSYVPPAGQGSWLTHARDSRSWTALLHQHGFVVAQSITLPHPTRPEAPGCIIIVTAVT